jgi:hypothetical protein
MPIRYECDDARRRVVVTVQGTIDPDDSLAVIERQRLNDAWGYGLLYDLRLMAGRLTLAELRPILGRTSQSRSGARRGPIAILATAPLVYDVACSYAALGRSTLTIEVFRDADEAEQWLTAKSVSEKHEHAPGRPSPPARNGRNSSD